MKNKSLKLREEYQRGREDACRDVIQHVLERAKVLFLQGKDESAVELRDQIRTLSLKARGQEETEWIPLQPRYGTKRAGPG